MNSRIPDEGETADFSSWAEFRDLLWSETDEDFRAGYADAEQYAAACLLSQNGVFVVTHGADGRITVENVG